MSRRYVRCANVAENSESFPHGFDSAAGQFWFHRWSRTHHLGFGNRCLGSHSRRVIVLLLVNPEINQKC